MSNAADGTTTRVVVNGFGVELVLLEGAVSFDATTNYQKYDRKVLGEQGTRTDAVYDSTTGSLTFARISENVEAFEAAYNAAVAARAPKTVTIVRTIFYPATGRVVVRTYPICTIDSFAQPVSRDGELMASFNFTCGVVPVDA